MVGLMVLSAVLSTQDPSASHVRATDPKVVAMFNAGMSRSATFRQLVDTLDHSDVVVYIQPKVTRDALGGYLSHNLIDAGAFRYLHIAVDIRGSDSRLVPVLAHELQHAVEVAQNPGARDERSLEELFEHLSIKFGCGGSTCVETQAAKDVEAAVRSELKARTAGRVMASAGQISPLVLHVRNYADLKTRDLDLKIGELLEAERLAAAVYARIGVRVVWTGSCAAAAAADGAFHFDVILLNAEMTARRQPTPPPMTFGQASRETRHAFIYTARIINHAIQTGSDPSRVLALVLAHEIGHMVLSESGHSTSGLMRPYKEGRIVAIPDFLPSQAEKIRSRLSASAPHEGREVCPAYVSPFEQVQG